MSQRVAFDARQAIDDGYGNVVAGDWQEQFRCRAEFMFARGSEEVMAARLEGRSPMLVRIYRSSASEAITTDWQMRDLGDGEAYNVRDVTWDNSRAVIDLLVEGGVATG
jgi:hypothetical protein